MPKKIHIETADRYKFFGILIVLATMVFCQMHYTGGRFVPISISKEMWTIIMAMITHTFMAMSKIRLEDKLIIHVRGIVAMGLLVTVGVCTMLQINVGKEWWSALGVVTAFLYGGDKGESGI